MATGPREGRRVVDLGGPGRQQAGQFVATDFAPGAECVQELIVVVDLVEGGRHWSASCSFTNVSRNLARARC